VALQSYLATRR
jgi:hypothetical protein